MYKYVSSSIRIPSAVLRIVKPLRRCALNGQKCFRIRFEWLPSISAFPNPHIFNSQQKKRKSTKSESEPNSNKYTTRRWHAFVLNRRSRVQLPNEMIYSINLFHPFDVIVEPRDPMQFVQREHVWTRLLNENSKRNRMFRDEREKFEIIILFAVGQHSNSHQSNDFQLNENILCANVYKCLNKHSNHLDFSKESIVLCALAQLQLREMQSGKNHSHNFDFPGNSGNQKHRPAFFKRQTEGNVAQWPLENAHNSHECLCLRMRIYTRLLVQFHLKLFR